MRGVPAVAPLPFLLAFAVALPSAASGDREGDPETRPLSEVIAELGAFAERGARAGEEAAASGRHAAGDIPYFARRYGVACSRCHVLPAKLNEFGERFLERGYRMPGLEAQSTVPLAVWASSRWESTSNDEDAPVHVNRVEIISGGELGASWLSYFVEWRALSLESRGDGTLRDRSGRFEDLFLVAQPGDWEVLAGQFRQVQQVDVSRRLSLSEPIVLSASLPGTGGDDARQRSLRGFSPAGRSPALRVGRVQPMADGWSWTAAASVPMPGEFSLPLTSEAREEASNEVELRTKGIFVESFARRGTTSLGGHLFYDDPGRYLAHAVAAAPAGPVHWEVMAGAAKSDDALSGRWSVQGDWFPHSLLGLGGRVEDRAGDGTGTAFLPYLNVHFPGTSYTIRLTVEQRLQSGRNATLVELGTIF